MIEVKVIPKARSRRRQPRREPAFRTKAFSLPVDIAMLIEREADLRYGGNQSALATAAFCAALGVTPKAEYALE